jgi:hypothetical protein
MFKILGADGKEYGPVTAAQLRQWIQEGRAGGPTQVRAEGAADWTRLQSLPEFADVFRAPPSAVSGGNSLPPIVQTLGVAMFVVALVGSLRLAASLVAMFRVGSGSFHPGIIYYLSWGVGLLSVPLRVVCGIGLLRRREWARRLAIGVAIVLSLFNLVGWARTATWLVNTPDAASSLLSSPAFWLPQLWSLIVFAFNIATIVLLCRPDVRAAFAPKSSTGV